jgi:type II secretory ATPase GspE/PulE/Tfp pilus assembly ATPase PilB-like protein
MSIDDPIAGGDSFEDADFEQFISETEDFDNGKDSSGSGHDLAKLSDLSDSELIQKLADYFNGGRPSGDSGGGLVSYVLYVGHLLRACEVSIEPSQGKFRIGIRPRSTGEWCYPEGWVFKGYLFPILVGRIKGVAGLDVAERRLSQDGFIEMNIGKELVKVSVHTLPTTDGEQYVLHYCDQGPKDLAFENLHFEEAVVEKMDALFSGPTKGIVFVAGSPDVSATLMSLLQRYRKPEDRVIAISDDSIDYPNCINVHPDNARGMDISNSLRGSSRQRPSILVCDYGYICTLGTLSQLCHMADGGQVIMARIPLNSAPATVSRLINSGVEPYLVAAAVKAVFGQRIVRLLCVECKVEVASGPYPFQAGGCPACYQTGYSGHRPVFDSLFTADHDSTQLVESDYLRELTLRSEATFRESGLRLAKEGLTSITEVSSVTSID